MVVLTRAKKRRLEEESLQDLISRLPDDVLGDIISFLPTKDGARTQILSSRWRQQRRSAPLNIDLYDDPTIPHGEISRILSSHRGSGRRFAVDEDFAKPSPMDAWLRSAALNNLEELEFHLRRRHTGWPHRPLPASACRFSSTLRVASFGRSGFPEPEKNAGGVLLHLPLLKQLTLSHVKISETSLNAFLAGCPKLESLLLLDNNGFSRLTITSPSLRSIGVRSGCLGLNQLIIEDAPCLERLLPFGCVWRATDIVVISAPRLDVLGLLSGHFDGLNFGSGCFRRSRQNIMDVLGGVKILALTEVNPSLDEVINLMKCSPRLETLYMEGSKMCGVMKTGINLIGTLDICLKKIVFTNYRSKTNTSHVKIAKFFVLNARLLESLRLELKDGNVSEEWIERQYRLLQIEKRASRSARFDFVPLKIFTRSLSRRQCAEQVHDLSTADPFNRLHV